MYSTVGNISKDKEIWIPKLSKDVVAQDGDSNSNSVEN